jgi:N-acetylglucosamine-6-phosphate deacetylase
MDHSRKRPALFDLQVNGFGGVDFQQLDLTQSALRGAVEALRRHYIYRILLTLISDEVDTLCRKLERIEAIRRADALVAETITGYHLEGPYLSPAPGYCGAHPPALMHSPSVREMERLCAAAGGHVKLITLAPEWPDSDEFISEARRQGIVIALGHTQAGERDIDMAIAAGATICTHLGNGVPQQLPRHDNVVQRLLARDELIACLIPDGLHLPPFVLKNFFRAKPVGKVVLTSDCMSAADAPPGRYAIGRLQVEVGRDGVAREPGKPNFAGSALTLDRGVANAAAWLEIAPDQAWRLASSSVAAIFSIELPIIDTVF